ncbi:MAG: palindromic element RPE3 domain-containing protein [Rickettsia endosymbiont of Ixodes ricinus]|nr:MULTISPECIES: palindromic element RPE3 domain-containing protein [spotted fever group]MCZ6896530.1 palindromic element RPE3 domain-containing protein [Rickettsia endosymbiont of Ixodes ricinus]
MSERFRQDKFKCEPAKAVDKLCEYRRVIQNSLVSSFMKYAVQKDGLVAWIGLCHSRVGGK